MAYCVLVTWAPAGAGKGGTCRAPVNVEKCFLLQMLLSKTSVNEVHHFEKMLSASGGSAPYPHRRSCLWTLLGDFRPSDPLIAHPWKKSYGRHVRKHS